MQPRYTLLLVSAFAGILQAASITDMDSTQPRGDTGPLTNGEGQSLTPVTDGFRAAARFASTDGVTPGAPKFDDWSGSMMAQAARDPAFLATLNVANQDVINLVRSMDAASFTAFLTTNGLEQDVTRDETTRRLTLLPTSPSYSAGATPAELTSRAEALVPVTGDMCLRCHSPTGWMEGRSEPATAHASFLKGQFWGSALRNVPNFAATTPVSEVLQHDSEGDLDGVTCDFCHRATDNKKRASYHDSSVQLPAGNGGFFVDPHNPFGDNGQPGISSNFQSSSAFCGTCHDVTNPLIRTQTMIPDPTTGQMRVAAGADGQPMQHPLERTFTEWYWTSLPGKKECRECHDPMKFLGAQTWMLSPVIDNLWGDMDAEWVDRGLVVNPSRSAALMDASKRNAGFMRTEAATVELLDLPANPAPGSTLNFKVKVTNLSGHKLPTGYGEGRQAWLWITVVDSAGNVIFEDGARDRKGKLIRTAQTKVYEQKIRATGYDANMVDGFNILDSNRDGVVSAKEKEFHFALINNIIKDNRIPPKGYNKAAYQADGAFIVPADTYADGQNWDITSYQVPLPANITGGVTVRARLLYQTFNREYIDFLASNDQEPTVANGGRAMNFPAGVRDAALLGDTWGKTLLKNWRRANNGQPVLMGLARAKVTVQ